ncbi:hypothetical protein C8J56DRAFT_359675 [Mycena floridula]|nr:hypothetical protein C8J56DRAFT_359675 [Mycena floridula]
MKPRSPYNGTSRKLLLAFDIGTTYSGISYSILDPGLVPEIRGVTRFPAQEKIGGDAKIPSMIYYDQHGAVKGVGAEARALEEWVLDEDEAENWSKCEWFKLHLRPGHQSTMDLESEDALHPLPPNKTVVDVFADMMEYLFQCSKAFISKSHPNGLQYWETLENDIEYVLTHPNGWEGAQQSQMRRAAITAGLIPDTEAGHARIHFVTEGEASLHYCLQNGLDKSVSDGQGIIIVDAGGGTVDLSAYARTSTSSGYLFEEIAKSECVVKGSIFVTRRAGKYLQRILRDSKFSGSQERMLEIFDDTTKLRFRNPGEPVYIRFGNPGDKDPSVGIKAGQLRLDGTVVADFFEPSIGLIIKAILAQKKSAKKPISSVFLVGGYGSSEYLFDRLQENVQSIGLSFSRPDSHVNKAVADGAVSFYLDHFVSTRVSRMTYGTKCSNQFISSNLEHIRRRSTVFIDAEGTSRIPKCFSVLLPKDVQVSETKEYKKTFYRVSRKRNFFLISETITCYRGEEPDPHWIDVDAAMYSTLCVIEADTSALNASLKPRPGQGGRISYRIDYDIILAFGLTELKAQICWKENGVEKRGPARVIYD